VSVWNDAINRDLQDDFLGRLHVPWASFISDTNQEEQWFKLKPRLLHVFGIMYIQSHNVVVDRGRYVQEQALTGSIKLKIHFKPKTKKEKKKDKKSKPECSQYDAK
jgi:hypothetical protein